MKLPTGTPGTEPFTAQFRSYMHPYPFGMPHPGRIWDGTDYRFGYRVESHSTAISPSRIPN